LKARKQRWHILQQYCIVRLFSKSQALPVFPIRAGAIFLYIDASQYSLSQYCTFGYQFACKGEGSCKFLEKRSCLKPKNMMNFIQNCSSYKFSCKKQHINIFSIHTCLHCM